MSALKRKESPMAMTAAKRQSQYATEIDAAFERMKKPKVETEAAAATASSFSSAAAASSAQADPPRVLKLYDRVSVGGEIGVVLGLEQLGAVVPARACVRFDKDGGDSLFSDPPTSAKWTYHPLSELTYVEPDPEFKWLVAKPERYNDVEIVQEEIGVGFKCAQVDLARIKSDFLTVWLEAEDTPGPNGVRRLTLPAGTCTSRHVFVALFDTLVSWGSDRPEIDLDLAGTIQLLHAADAIGCFALSAIHPFRSAIRDGAREEKPVVSHTELLQVAMRYHMEDVIRLCAYWFKRHPETPMSVVETHACATYWRIE